MISETALALVLLGGAGMLLKTLVTLRATAPGFTTQNLLTLVEVSAVLVLVALSASYIPARRGCVWIQS